MTTTTTPMHSLLFGRFCIVCKLSCVPFMVSMCNARHLALYPPPHIQTFAPLKAHSNTQNMCQYVPQICVCLTCVNSNLHVFVLCRLVLFRDELFVFSLPRKGLHFLLCVCRLLSSSSNSLCRNIDELNSVWACKFHLLYEFTNSLAVRIL